MNTIFTDRTFSELRRFYADVTSIIVIVDFIQYETVGFNIMYQLSPFYNERKEFCSSYHCSINTSDDSFLRSISNRVVRTLSDLLPLLLPLFC
jgi:hypothetical protein